MPLSNFTRAKVQGRIAQGETDADWIPATLYRVHLYTDSVDGDGVGTELSGGDYAPVQVPVVGSFTIGAAPLFEVVNVVDVDFGAAGVALGPIVSFAVRDQNGNALWFDDLDVPRNPDAGQTYSFPPGTLRTRFDPTP